MHFVDDGALRHFGHSQFDAGMDPKSVVIGVNTGTTYVFFQGPSANCIDILSHSSNSSLEWASVVFADLPCQKGQMRPLQP